jgi:CheY-like chemotaxis protein
MAQSEPVRTKILVVDDDEDVLAVTSALLAHEGYDVLIAQAAGEALALLDRHRDIALLFTDIVLPGGMDGFDLAEAAKARRPALSVMYTSGYLKNEGAWAGTLLPKPWTEDDLKRAMAEVWPRPAA